jgi:hypothetical protein
MKGRDWVEVVGVAVAAFLLVSAAYDALGRGWVHLVLGIGPGLAALMIGVVSKARPRHVLSWAVPLIVVQTGALLLLPLPADFAVWFVAFGFFLLMLFSDRAEKSWARLVDRILA